MVVTQLSFYMPFTLRDTVFYCTLGRATPHYNKYFKWQVGGNSFHFYRVVGGGPKLEKYNNRRPLRVQNNIKYSEKFLPFKEGSFLRSLMYERDCRSV